MSFRPTYEDCNTAAAANRLQTPVNDWDYDLRKINTDVVKRAIKRAKICGTFWETNCVYGFEIGLRMPTFFLLDCHNCEMYLQPEIVNFTNTTSAVVGVRDVNDGGLLFQKSYFTEVVIEYFEYLKDSNSDLVVGKKTLYQHDAFCAQLHKEIYD